MKDLLLFVPLDTFAKAQYEFLPLGPLYLASYLNEAGFEVDVLHGLPEEIPPGYRFYGCSAPTAQYTMILKALDRIREVQPGAVTIAGGAHFNARSCIEDALPSGWDYIVSGPGEKAAVEIMSGKAQDHVVYGSHLDDIDSAPFPAYDKIDVSKYSFPLGDGRKCGTIITSRGCPFKCLAGGTIVHTTYGDLTIKHIADNYDSIGVLTRDPKTKDAVFAQASVIKKTREDADLVRVKFDDGTHIDCTPDHLFMTFKHGNQFGPTEETEVEATNLMPGQSVCAVKFAETKQGYLDVIWSRRKRRRLHRLIMDFVHGRKLARSDFVHHLDGNKLNNSLDNLVLTNESEHIRLYHPEISERMKKNNPTFNTPHEILSERSRKATKGLKRSFESRLRYRESKLGKKNPQYKHGLSKHKSRIKEINEEDKEINHRVVSVEVLATKEDTYCLEVPGYSWFYANGVLVHNCAFCSSAGTKMKQRSVDNILEEIDLLVNTFGFNSLMFVDDTMSVGAARYESLLKGIEKFNIKWRAYGRTSTVSHKHLEMMKQSGCIECAPGIESGSQEILNLVGKKTKVENNIEWCRKCEEVGISCTPMVIIGLPGETPDTIKSTRQFMEEAKPSKFGYNILMPFPDSPIMQNYDYWNEYITVHPYTWDDCVTKSKKITECFVSTPTLSREEILKEYYRNFDMFADITGFDPRRRGTREDTGSYRDEYKK